MPHAPRPPRAPTRQPRSADPAPALHDEDSRDGDAHDDAPDAGADDARAAAAAAGDATGPGAETGAATGAVDYACTHCGSPALVRDAWAEWDAHGQRWRLNALFDYAFCQSCHRRTPLIARAIADGR